MAKVFPSSHPLILHKVAELRAKGTAPPEFRRLVRSLAALLLMEATTDLGQVDEVVETPLGPCPSRKVGERVVVVPILRAGLGMADGVLDVLPEAEIWHVGLKRDEQTLLPSEYYKKLPHHVRDALVLIVDPMLATGGSAVHACDLVKGAGASRIKYLALISAPEGIARLNEAHPDVVVHVGAVDQHLNEIGYIYPGLGDAGDRQFATFEA